MLKKLVLVLGLLMLCGCQESANRASNLTPSNNSTSETTSTASKPTPTEPTWDFKTQHDPIDDVTEEWWSVSGTAGAAELKSTSVAALGETIELTHFPRLSVLCINHKLKQAQLKPNLVYSAESDRSIVARLDNTKKTFHWSMATDYETFLFYKADLQILLAHRNVILGVTSRGSVVPIRFTVPTASTAMKQSCSLL